MNETGLLEQVRRFTKDLIEDSGGVVEWAEESPDGHAIVPLEVANCLGQNTDVFPLSTRAAQPGLSLNIAGEFLDVAGKALRSFVPACGSFHIADLPVKKSDYQQAVDASFGWQNARARVVEGNPCHVSYHTLWFHVVLRSDDAWETVVRATVNSQTGLVVELGNILETIQLTEARHETVPPNLTLNPAVRWVEQESMRLADPFLARIDQRLQRDRKRLREYYAALLRESKTPNRRTKVPSSETEIADRERAVKLELQRKLSELDERFAIAGTLRPIAFADCRVPTAVIDLEVQRKAAKRIFRVYWNGLLRRLEPLVCSQCQTGAFNLWFSNDDVEPICAACHSKSHSHASSQ